MRIPRQACARIPGVPYNPSLGYINNTLIQSTMQHNAAGAVAKDKPNSSPALGGGYKQRLFQIKYLFDLE